MIKVGTYELDALVRISPDHRNETTIHPVQDGADITDHVIERPLTLDVSGIVSNTPISLLAKERTEGADHGLAAYEYLVKLMKDKTLVDIESGVYPVFSGMLLLSLSPPKDASTGDSFRFSASFQQTVFATVDTENIETLVALPRAEKKKRKGQVPPTVEDVPTDAAAAKADKKSSDVGKSWAASLIDLGGAL